MNKVKGWALAVTTSNDEFRQLTELLGGQFQLLQGGMDCLVGRDFQAVIVPPKLRDFALGRFNGQVFVIRVKKKKLVLKLCERPVEVEIPLCEPQNVGEFARNMQIDHRKAYENTLEHLKGFVVSGYKSVPLRLVAVAMVVAVLLFQSSDVANDLARQTAAYFTEPKENLKEKYPVRFDSTKPGGFTVTPSTSTVEW